MKLSFIGGGNMATSLIGGLIADGYQADAISVVDVKQEVLDALAQRFGVITHHEISDEVLQADVVAICVKPQGFEQVARAMAPLLQSLPAKPLIVSIAAGLRTRDIANWLGGDYAIVRAMPNTPSLVQCGAAALFASPEVSDTQKDQAESLIRATGLVSWVSDEDLMDVVTALSGSGPAYFFRIMEALVKGAEELGLPQKTAYLLTLQTALGAAKMAVESEQNIATLRQQVTSPGGTTEQGLNVLNDNNIDDLMARVLGAAHTRSKELAKQLGEN